MEPTKTKPLAGFYVAPYDLEELRRALAAVENCRKAIGMINPRPSGLHNQLVQFAKKLLARSLEWYTRPLQEFHGSVMLSLTEIYSVLEHLSANMVALDEKLGHEQLELLHDQVKALVSLENATTEESPAGALTKTGDESDVPQFPYSFETRLGNDRTTYILGLFGTGRLYINHLILQNIGTRAKFFRDQLRLYPGPTSMICSGHVTMKYISRGQSLPEIMHRIEHAVKVRFADSIFIYRHPLDSLLTNWVYWRNYLRDNRSVCGISEVYENPDDLCADLDTNFFEFTAFAEGHADFYAGLIGPPFLSFAQFVEETALHYQAASLTLRLEDFTFDPVREFSKIAELMSADLDLSGVRIPPPRSKPYVHQAVKEKVPRFKNFISRMDLETKRKIEKIGYRVGD